jgi:hypothetical protein
MASFYGATTLRITTEHNDTQHNNIYNVAFRTMTLSIMQSIVMLSVLYKLFMLSVIMLNVIKLSLFMLSVVVPFYSLFNYFQIIRCFNGLMHCYQNRLAHFVTGVSYSRKLFIKLASDWPFLRTHNL